MFNVATIVTKSQSQLMPLAIFLLTKRKLPLRETHFNLSKLYCKTIAKTSKFAKIIFVSFV